MTRPPLRRPSPLPKQVAVLALLAVAAIAPVAALSYYAEPGARRLHATKAGYGYYAATARRALAGADTDAAGARRLFGAWEAHSVPLPTHLTSASRTLAAYGYYSVSCSSLGPGVLAWPALLLFEWRWGCV